MYMYSELRPKLNGIQWSPSNPDTLRTGESGRINEVPSFQELLTWHRCGLSLKSMMQCDVANEAHVREISSSIVFIALYLASSSSCCLTSESTKFMPNSVCCKGEFVWTMIPLGPSQVSALRIQRGACISWGLFASINFMEMAFQTEQQYRRWIHFRSVCVQDEVPLQLDQTSMIKINIILYQIVVFSSFHSS